ncbi:unnamed protein product [Mytilus coruscus]|uniref:ShKT domain-containing protein n=1 Tax=Mytilus coruscus TaxID=42192 RepID=A0A6J8EI46_MYTCO|nr:unnamed protein product [Mytilus coruscus]
MLYSVTILAILINIASSITQDCYFFPDSRIECVEYIDIQKGKHGCTTLKDSVPVTGISNVIDGDKWIEIIETNGEGKNAKYVRLQNGDCSNNCCELGAELIHSIVKTDHKGHIVAILDTTASKLKTLITTTGRAITTTTEQPATTAKPCVDEPFVNCHDSKICQSPFRDSCPFSCGDCVPVTTRKPCVDNKFVQCYDQSACSSRFRQYCPESCNLCGLLNTISAHNFAIDK